MGLRRMGMEDARLVRRWCCMLFAMMARAGTVVYHPLCCCEDDLNIVMFVQSEFVLRRSSLRKLSMLPAKCLLKLALSKEKFTLFIIVVAWRILKKIYRSAVSLRDVSYAGLTTSRWISIRCVRLRKRDDVNEARLFW